MRNQCHGNHSIYLGPSYGYNRKDPNAKSWSEGGLSFSLRHDVGSTGASGANSKHMSHLKRGGSQSVLRSDLLQVEFVFEVPHDAVVDFAGPVHPQDFGPTGLKRLENSLEVVSFNALMRVTVSFILGGNLGSMPVLFEQPGMPLDAMLLP